jgi:hypothetical protein
MPKVDETMLNNNNFKLKIKASLISSFKKRYPNVGLLKPENKPTERRKYILFFIFDLILQK